jgi:hypothetical protein
MQDLKNHEENFVFAFVKFRIPQAMCITSFRHEMLISAASFGNSNFYYE